MKIERNPPPDPQAGKVKERSQLAGLETGAARLPVAPGADEARVSKAADTLGLQQTTLQERKVEKIKEIYERGLYSVPSEKIARALVGEHEQS